MPEFNNIVSAAGGVHDGCADEIKANVPLGSKIVDLGCGEGKALYQLDGYDRKGVDLVNNFRLDLPFCEMNLNQDLPIPNETFDAVISSEVMEHVENSWHFTREIARILKPNGIAVLTTPNVNSLLSRIGFLRKGTFRMFEEEHYRDWGHITPLSWFLLEKMFNKAGLKVIKHQYNKASYYSDGIVGNKWQRFVQKILLFLFKFKGELGGDVNIITLKKE